ncbi:hypothetical protein HDU98_009081 [Podochytrium sp. JEL0797]|nr:hypothetical protein HDU98_009081 [Podochytrium sp. JEL0797]
MNQQLQILLFQLLFLITGVCSTIGAQWVHYRGAANSWSFVTSLCQFLGMFLVACLPPPRILSKHAAVMPVATRPASFPASALHGVKSHLDRYGPVSVRGAAVISIVEVVGNLINVAGMFLTGSGLYMVIYSSIVVFTALFSRILLKDRKLTGVQWGSVCAICLGLSITAVGSSGQQDKSGSSILFGILVCLLGTSLLSLVYVANDHLLTENLATPYSQSIYVGLFSTLFTLLVMLLISIPTLLTLPLFDWDVVLAHLILILSSLGHSVAYFELVEATGGVATGVLQGLRAVLVFGLSDVWFCGRDEGQCFTVYKGVATVVVVCGVGVFAAAKGMKGHSHGGDKVALQDSVDEEEEFGMDEGEDGDVLLKDMGRLDDGLE